MSDGTILRNGQQQQVGDAEGKMLMAQAALPEVHK
jgi:hypothetical protein